MVDTSSPEDIQYKLKLSLPPTAHSPEPSHVAITDFKRETQDSTTASCHSTGGDMLRSVCQEMRLL